MIQQYRTLKSKLLKYRLKKSSIPQNTVNPQVRFNIPLILFSSYQLIQKIDGNKERGRPRRPWGRDIQDVFDMSLTEVGRLAIDRDSFCCAVKDATFYGDKQLE